MQHILTKALSTVALVSLLTGASAAQGPGPEAGSGKGDSRTEQEYSGPSGESELSPRRRLDQGVQRLQALTKPRDIALNRELGELLQSNPGLQVEIPAILRRREVSPKTSDTLIFLLERIGSESAQEELVLIQADSGIRHLDRLRAIMAIGSLPEVTVASLDQLWVTSSRRLDTRSVDLSNTALLSLGIAGNRLRSQGSPRYDELRDGLVARLLTATHAPEVAMVLKAIGNLHDVALGNHVEPYLYEKSAPVRATAAQTLGRIGDVSKRPLLMELLPRERHGAVRASMTQALREFPADEDVVQLVHSIVRNERNMEARALMVQLLVENLEEFPEPLQMLRDMAATDPSNRVRMLAGSALRH